MLRWKCHLAHTDAAEVSQIRDERWSSVMVNIIRLLRIHLNNMFNHYLIHTF